MGHTFFRLGDSVHLEFISPEEEDSIAVEPCSTGASSSSFLAIDLVNFTGRLLVSRSSDVTEATSGTSPEAEVRSESPDTSILADSWDEDDISTYTSPPRAQRVALLSDDTPRHQNHTSSCDENEEPNLLGNAIEAPASQEEEEDDTALDSGEGCDDDDDDDDATPIPDDNNAEVAALEDSSEEKSALVSRHADDFSFRSAVSSIMSSNTGLVDILEDSTVHIESKTDEVELTEESLYKPSPRRRRMDGVSMFHTPYTKKPSSKAKPWGLVFAAAQLRKRMPSQMQERRSEQREAAIADPHHTKLHIQCGKPETTLQQLHDAFLRNPEAVSLRNSRGCLPLHILADNEELVQSPQGREIATTFALELMRAHPESVTCKDVSGNMPFMGLIRDWLDWAYEIKGGKGSKTRNPNAKFGVGEAVDRLRDRISIFHNTKDDSRELADVASPLAGGKKSWIPNASSSSSSSSQSFPRVSLWNEVEWCFSMLSLVMDELGGKSGGLHKNTRRNLRAPDLQDKICRDLLPTYMAEKFPFLLKTVLLLEEDGGETRRRLLKMSIFRRILVCPESVGPWLTSMLHKKGIPSIRGVDYLAMLSQTSVEDYVGGFRTILLEDIDNFHEHRCRLFDAIEALPGTIASLVILDERETERAAATQVAWYIMSKNLLRPFVVGLVLIDFVLHITLMLAFRNDVRIRKNDSGVVGAIGDEVPTQVVLFICCHYLIRKSCEALSLLSLSPIVFQSYFTNIWTLFDILAIVLTMVAVCWHDNHPDQYRQGFNAFVLGLLWMKVLGFLKVVNKQMSTFILALFEILHDIRYFAAVLAVILLMFGDMMHIVLSTKDNGEYCLANEDNLGGPALDFCSPNLGNSYLRVYALLLGDFDLDDYKESSGITVLFVVFTLLGVVILLNVLIAVISDSYEKATISSLLLFGRARVAFVAQNQALESFLRPGADQTIDARTMNRSGRFWNTASRIGRWLVLLSLIITAMDTEVYLVVRAINLIRDKDSFAVIVVVVVLSVLLTGALWVVVGFSIENLIRDFAPAPVVRCFDSMDGYTAFYVGIIGSRLFGLQDTVRVPTTVNGNGVETSEEWTGRLMYMEKAMQKIVASSQDQISSEIRALEKRMQKQHDTKVDEAASTDSQKTGISGDTS